MFQVLYHQPIESIRIPHLQVCTAIKREDSLSAGESYYFFEIKALLAFINTANQNNAKYLFLIDEIYRGTNTIERIAASAAVLSDLSPHNIVLVTTHDVELHELLQTQFQTFHFNENADPTRLF